MTTSIQSIDANTSSVQVGGQEAMRLTTSGVVVASQNGGPIAGNRNRIINGNFVINQRAAASASTAYGAGVYCLDRWKAGAAGATLSWAVSGNDVVVTITAGSIMQVVEDLNIEGGVYALSHAGSAQARVGVNGAVPSAAYAVASQASPVVSATATAKQTVTVEFSTGTVSKVQLEPVDSANVKATPFERRLYGLELALCQRYVVTLGGNFSGQAFSANLSGHTVPLPPLRATPTLSTTSGWTVTTAGGGSNPCTPTIGAFNATAIYVSTTGATALTSGNAALLTPPAGAYVSAEL